MIATDRMAHPRPPQHAQRAAGGFLSYKKPRRGEIDTSNIVCNTTPTLLYIYYK
jgi:hypothetical protein